MRETKLAAFSFVIHQMLSICWDENPKFTSVVSFQHFFGKFVELVFRIIYNISCKIRKSMVDKVGVYSRVTEKVVVEARDYGWFQPFIMPGVGSHHQNQRESVP